MIRALIIEDEPLAAKRLARMIHEINSEVEILDILDTVSSAVQWLKLKEADLIFVDIHLADGNSFTIFEQIQVKTPIIFTTAYDEYAIQAFKLNSIDYLLKPIEKSELAYSLQKFQSNQTSASAPSVDMQAIWQAIQEQQTAPPSFQKRFMVSSGDKIKSIPVE
ncbi:MAG: response regulator, partial [Bacteroidota bacterium]